MENIIFLVGFLITFIILEIKTLITKRFMGSIKDFKDYLVANVVILGLSFLGGLGSLSICYELMPHYKGLLIIIATIGILIKYCLYKKFIEEEIRWIKKLKNLDR